MGFLSKLFKSVGKGIAKVASGVGKVVKGTAKIVTKALPVAGLIGGIGGVLLGGLGSTVAGKIKEIANKATSAGVSKTAADIANLKKQYPEQAAEIEQAAITAQILPPGYAAAKGIAGFFKNPLVLVGIGVLLVMLIKRK